MTQNGDVIWYEIDLADRIGAVGGAWNAFALDNNGEALVGASVIGTSIFDHIAGHFTKRFFREFLANGRSSSQSKRTYRCDAPDRKRLMEMRAETTCDSRLRVSHTITEELPIERAVFVTEVGRSGLADHVRCSLCNRLRFRGSNAWREPDAAVPDGGSVRVIHTVCPDCRAEVSARALWPRPS
jgi:hypothetical protein